MLYPGPKLNTPKRRRAAMQAAVYNARERRLGIGSAGTIPTGPVVPTVLTQSVFNPSDKSSTLTLSNGNATVQSSDATTAANLVRGTQFRGTGDSYPLRYLEFQNVQLDDNGAWVGFANASAAGGGTNTNIFVWDSDSGTIVKDNQFNASQGSYKYPHSGDVLPTIRFALNLAKGWAVAQIDNLGWAPFSSGVAGGDPSATVFKGTNVFDISGLLAKGLLAPACHIRYDGTIPNGFGEATLVTNNSFKYPLPTGYAPWG